MKYLSGMDNLFLSQETSTQHMHVGGLGLYNPCTAPGGFVRFKNILDFFTERLSEAPVFRRSLTNSLLDTGRPFWVDDPNVDVEYHVRHMALPEPGDWRQLMIQIARIHSRPMDLTKPLWEAYIIEGLDNIEWLPEGSFALYLKFHHSAVDGEAGAHLIGNLHTTTPDFHEAPLEHKKIFRTQRSPQASEILSRAMLRRFDQVKGLRDLGISLGSYALKSASPGSLKKVLAQNSDVKALIKSQLEPKAKRPKTRFNDRISSHRVLESADISLDECNAIRKHLGRSTINDVFLCVVGGALRDYLIEKGEPPLGNLKGSMPMTLRGENKSGDVGNQIAQVYYDLHSQIVDPIERLDAISHEIRNLKHDLDTGLGKDFQSRLLELLPASLIAKSLTKSLGENANVNISNVRGPNFSMYMAGAKLERFIPFSIVTDGLGLNITGFSYNGILSVAITSCREMMPDPKRFSEILLASFDELKAAVFTTGQQRPATKVTRKNTAKKKVSKRRKKLTTKKISARASTATMTDKSPRTKKKISKRQRNVAK
jgi:WS/DGAT/MGAT family acyltransferase